VVLVSFSSFPVGFEKKLRPRILEVILDGFELGTLLILSKFSLLKANKQIIQFKKLIMSFKILVK